MEPAKNGKDKILEKLRRGRKERKEVPYSDPGWADPVFPHPDNLLETFRTELEAVQGIVIIEDSETELIGKIEQILAQRNLESLYCLDGELKKILSSHINIEYKADQFHSMQAAITRCEQLVARTGSVVVSSAHESGRRLNAFPSLHIIWAKSGQLVPFMEDAIDAIMNRYGNNIPSLITSITGPSRTADIEKTLVLGAHGPRELIVLINRNE